MMSDVEPASKKQPTPGMRWFTSDNRLAYGFMIAIFIGWGVGLIFSLCSQEGFLDGIRVFCLLWLTSGAAFFTGSMTGFIFGFPKANKISPEQIVPDRYGDNTNLEEVSDWLTKIIVGITIAEFRDIVQFVVGIGSAVGTSISAKDDGGAHVVVVASIIYGFVCGFLYYYTWARLAFHNELLKRYRNAAFQASKKEHRHPDETAPEDTP